MIYEWGQILYFTMEIFFINKVLIFKIFKNYNFKIAKTPSSA